MVSLLFSSSRNFVLLSQGQGENRSRQRICKTLQGLLKPRRTRFHNGMFGVAEALAKVLDRNDDFIVVSPVLKKWKGKEQNKKILVPVGLRKSGHITFDLGNICSWVENPKWLASCNLDNKVLRSYSIQSAFQGVGCAKENFRAHIYSTVWCKVSWKRCMRKITFSVFFFFIFYTKERKQLG